ncbi:hypothetical protein [Polaribacter sp. Asnod6-C07]|uniref:hypothetical protein n=1 Tax=Polaribacter sp. Asnod6-C07 TaxID=3160582 RepID=UPI003864BDB9
MKKVLSLFLVFSATAIISQEKYRVTYNYQTEVINYYKLDKLNNIEDTLKSPKFKRNSLIELRLTNVNPFAVNIKTDVKEETIHPKMSGFNFSSLLGNVNSLSGESLNLNVGSVAGENSFLSRGKDPQAAKSRGDKLSNQFSDLNKLTTNIDAIEASFRSNLLNPNFDKTEILKNLKESSSKFMDARIPNPKENYYTFLYNLDNAVKEDTRELQNEIANISSEIDETLDSEKPMSRGELVQTNNAFKNLEALKLSLNAKQTNTSESLNTIKNLYTSLEASNFEQTYDYIIEADKVGIELKFIQSELAQTEGAEANLIKTRSLNLFSKGGFKINTSVALTLNNFGSKSKEFFIDENNIIGEDTGNGSTPNLSTMINFYPVISESFNIGGSFGVSIPVSGEARGINFLLGPTIFLGSKSRLSLSGGVAYGTVTKLKNGLEVGDTATFTDIDLFTKSVYDFGYYFGISFSLFELN